MKGVGAFFVLMMLCVVGGTLFLTWICVRAILAGSLSIGTLIIAAIVLIMIFLAGRRLKSYKVR